MTISETSVYPFASGGLVSSVKQQETCTVLELNYDGDGAHGRIRVYATPAQLAVLAHALITADHVYELLPDLVREQLTRDVGPATPGHARHWTLAGPLCVCGHGIDDHNDEPESHHECLVHWTDAVYSESGGCQCTMFRRFESKVQS